METQLLLVKLAIHILEADKCFFALVTHFGILAKLSAKSGHYFYTFNSRLNATHTIQWDRWDAEI
jgi:hypothetical protein